MVVGMGAALPASAQGRGVPAYPWARDGIVHFCEECFVVCSSRPLYPRREPMQSFAQGVGL